jgi:predicted DNA-binding protein (UPF0251 family)
MGRQPLSRRVGALPLVNYFKPAGIPLANIQEVRLSVEEAEAIRLKDVDGLEQDACAKKMSVSRSTFARILLSARQKMADALLNGKAIRIEGGNYEMAVRRFRCGNGHEWEVPFEVMIKEPPELCPTCSTPDIMSLTPWKPGMGMAGRGRQFRAGRNYRKGGD